MNLVILNGRIAKDLRVAETNNIKICKFILAVDRYNSKKKEMETDFISCTAFRNAADFIIRNFEKGSKIIIRGNLKSGSFIDPNTNEKRFSTDVIVEKVEFDETKEAVENRRKNNTKSSDEKSSDEKVPFTNEYAYDEIYCEDEI